MALENLIATLETEAKAEADSVLATARTQAASLIASAEEQFRRRRDEAAKAREQRLRASLEQGLLEERRRARRTVLEGREQLLQRVLGAARPLFADALRSEAYRARLAGWATEAFECLGEQTARLLCHSSLVKELTRLAEGRRHLSVVADPQTGPGFRAVSDDGAMEVDCTLEGRLQALLPTLAIEVFAKFEQES